jgi:ankyrin repeat protein
MKLQLNQCLLIPVVLILVAGCATTRSKLLMASWDGNTNRVQALLAKGAEVNTKDSRGMTALMVASEKGHVEVVKALLASGADVNIKTNEGWTALMFASEKGDIETVLALLTKEPDVNARNKDGKTALTIAKEKEHKEIERVLQEVAETGYTEAVRVRPVEQPENRRLFTELNSKVTELHNRDGIQKLLK